jgi:hypothetical protein
MSRIIQSLVKPHRSPRQAELWGSFMVHNDYRSKVAGYKLHINRRGAKIVKDGASGLPRVAQKRKLHQEE